MSLDLQHAEDPPVTAIGELLELFRLAERPRAEHQLGLEHEKLLFRVESGLPVPYEGERGVGALLQAIARAGRHEQFHEAPGAPVIALTRGRATLSLEPGGQLELSGTPAATAREAHRENLAHLAEVKAAAVSFNLGLAALGYRPYSSVQTMPWMPKTRYQVMKKTLGARGALATDMMLMTATGQVSLDWADEADCARKVALAARVNPVLVALCANSPLKDGRPTGLLSYRSHVWTQVDPARCGYLPAMLDGSFSYRAYAEWALDAPLLFLRRGGRYLTPRLTFRQLLREGFDGGPARWGDWIDHLSTLFPEVRIKRVMEVRGADCVSAEMTGGLVALMRGLYYDPVAMAEAEALLPCFRLEEHLAFHAAAREQGLRAQSFGHSMAALAREVVAIARRALMRIDPADAPLLEPLEEVAASGRSLAERVLAAYQKDPTSAKVLGAFAL